MEAFILAMMLNPEAQEKAQQEIDRLTGGTRLPVSSDRGDLPFVNALCKEVYRWHSVTPTGKASSARVRIKQY